MDAQAREVYTFETEDGILLTPFDPEFALVMEAEERISKKYQNALRELAKRTSPFGYNVLGLMHCL